MPHDMTALPLRVPRASKRRAGKTSIHETPLHVRLIGVALSADDKAALQKQFGRKLARFAEHITKVVVRFEDLNGPKGGVDTVCRIKLSVANMDDLVVEARAEDAATAARIAGRQAKISLERALRRRGTTSTTKRREETIARRASRAPPRQRPPGGSFIGRRVGRSRANLLRAAERPEKERRDAIVDTSLPGVSATDRKAGGGSTAARNTRLRAPRAAATLEDSATKPSRKSTRKSRNRQKSGTKQARRQKRRLQSPSARARRARAGGREGSN